MTTEFAYDGQGNRLAQTVAGVTTAYVLDVAGGLPPVIVETTGGQTTAYLPGLAQDQGAAWAYYLPDALGSVRHLTDAGAQVTLARSYEPFGKLLAQAGTGSSGFGFAGEQRDASTGLVFLRARYYDPALGRFVSKDPWSGSIARPQTQNGWAYVSNNPINQTDASGLCEGYADWECWAVYRQVIRKFPYLPKFSEEKYGVKLYTLPKDVLEAILSRPSAEAITQGSPSNVLALIRLFEADHFPGNNARDRLQWILNQQASWGVTKSYLQFGGLFPDDDSGFCEELADQRLYDEYWASAIREIKQRPDGEPRSNQIGHFLTAVALGFNPGGAYYQAYPLDLVLMGENDISLPRTAEEHALNLIVGHEMVGDQPGPIGQFVAIPEQYSAATEEARNLFRKAIEYDRQGNDALRDQALQEILLSTDPSFTGEAIRGGTRIGNSLPDLRNSIKGWRFGQEIRDGLVTTRTDAALWLRREVYDPSLSRRRPRE